MGLGRAALTSIQVEENTSGVAITPTEARKDTRLQWQNGLRIRSSSYTAWKVPVVIRHGIRRPTFLIEGEANSTQLTDFRAQLNASSPSGRRPSCMFT